MSENHIWRYLTLFVAHMTALRSSHENKMGTPTIFDAYSLSERNIKYKLNMII